MKPATIIVDTGPLVAFLNQRDRYHQWTLNQFSLLLPPFYTCEAVISETSFILRNFEKGTSKLLALMDRELLRISFNLQDEYTTIDKLLKKYKDIPMSLADACLVRMSEQIANSKICTLDNDFKIYRKHQRKIIPLIFPKNY